MSWKDKVKKESTKAETSYDQKSTKHVDGTTTVRTGVTITMSRSYQSISVQTGLEKTVPASDEQKEFARQFEVLDGQVSDRTDEMKAVLSEFEKFHHEGGN